MEPYNLFADLLSTFRSLNDWIKALMVIGFYAAPVGLAWAWAYAKRGQTSEDGAPEETPEPELDALAEGAPNRAALDVPPVEVKPVDAEPADPARLAAPDARGVRGPRIEKL